MSFTMCGKIECSNSNHGSISSRFYPSGFPALVRSEKTGINQVNVATPSSFAQYFNGPWTLELRAEDLQPYRESGMDASITVAGK